MELMQQAELDQVSGGMINTPNELAAGLIMAAAGGMTGALLGALGGPVGMAGGAVTGARLGFMFIEKITR